MFNLDQEPPAPTLVIIGQIEVATAIKSLKNNKAPGLDEVSTKLLNHGGEHVERLTNLFNLMWRSEEISVTATTGGLAHCCLYLPRYFALCCSNA